MADSTLSTMDAVAALMQEREKYEGWLAALDGRRAATPPRVYERVSADYRARLDHVLADIAGRASELEAVSAGLRSRVQTLEADEELRLEERAEAEVRAAVGEYSPEQWEELRSVADAEIAHVSAQLGEQRAELARVDGILSIARGPRADAPRSADAASAPAAAAGASAPAAVAGATPVREQARDYGREAGREPLREPLREPSRWSGEAAAAAPQAERFGDRPSDRSIERTSADRMAARGDAATTPEASVIIPFTVEGEGRDAVPRDVAPREAAPRDGEGTTRRPTADQAWASDQSGNDAAFDDLAFLKSIVEPTAPAGGAAPPGGASASSPSAAPAAGGAARPPARGEESRLSTPGRGLAALRSLLGTDDKSTASGVGGGSANAAGREEQRQSAAARDEGGTAGGAKTLRCGECGTLNYPTEWYCERCGGELAAM